MTDSVNRVLDLAVRIQQIPAPTFGEGRRAEFVRGLFAGEGLLDVSMDPLNNVYARLAGSDATPPLIVSAHLDTVFPANTVLDHSREADRICGPGIGDNSLGVAALFGLLWELRSRGTRPAGDVWFTANVCEEGLGDLRGMNAVVERFGAYVRAYLVIEGTALGHVYHQAIGVARYRVKVRTAGGHSWSDYGEPSAIHEAARLVTQITALPVSASPRTTLNVGLISGGTGVNVLASEAIFELDLRSESSENLATLVQQVEQGLGSGRKGGVEIEVAVIGRRPGGEIPKAHPLVRLAAECLSELGLQATLTTGSTDANVPLSRGFPAIVLGVTTGARAHTAHEYIDIAPVEIGIEQLVRFVDRVFRVA